MSVCVLHLESPRTDSSHDPSDSLTTRITGRHHMCDRSKRNYTEPKFSSKTTTKKTTTTTKQKVTTIIKKIEQVKMCDYL